MGTILVRERSDGTVSFTAYRSRRSLGTFSSREHAQAVLNGVIPAGVQAQTFADHALGWLPTAGKAADPGVPLEASTKKAYEIVLRRHVVPRIGDLVVADITTADIRAMMSAALNEGVSVRIRQNMLAVTSAALNALTWGDPPVLTVNPARGVRTPSGERVEPTELTVADAHHLLDRLPSVGKLFIEFCLETGARFGEATEIRPRGFGPTTLAVDFDPGAVDINFTTRVVTFSRAVADLGTYPNPLGTGRFMVKRTKGKRTRRVPISAELADALAAHIAEHNIGPHDLVFGEPVLTPRRRQRRARTKGSRNVTGHASGENWRRVLQAACEGLDHPVVQHSTRHAFVTWCLRAGMPLRDVQVMAGHSSIAQTERYAKAIEAERAPSAGIMRNLLAQ